MSASLLCCQWITTIATPCAGWPLLNVTQAMGGCFSPNACSSASRVPAPSVGTGIFACCLPPSVYVAFDGLCHASMLRSLFVVLFTTLTGNKAYKAVLTEFLAAASLSLPGHHVSFCCIPSLLAPVVNKVLCQWHHPMTSEGTDGWPIVAAYFCGKVGYAVGLQLTKISTSFLCSALRMWTG